MNYEKAGKAYVELTNQIAAIEAKAKSETAILKQQLKDIETWFTIKADAEGLKNVPTTVGTAYWSTHSSAKVANRTEFFDFVKEHDAFDMLEARVSKLAVAAHIEKYNSAPPGVDFSQVRVFNFRQAKGGKDETRDGGLGDDVPKS